MAFAEPALFERLIDLLTTTPADYLCAQVEAGAEAVMLFDSWAGLLPPSQFRRHVIEPTRQIVAALKARYPHVRVVGFPRLGGVMVAEYARQTGVDVVALDTGADIAQIRPLLPAGAGIQGTLDPISVLAGVQAMRAEARAICPAGRALPPVFHLGHGVLPETTVDPVADPGPHVR